MFAVVVSFFLHFLLLNTHYPTSLSDPRRKYTVYQVASKLSVELDKFTKLYRSSKLRNFETILFSTLIFGASFCFELQQFVENVKQP